MKTLLALSFLAFTTVAVAGPSVSGGIVYQESFELCANKTTKATLTVEALLTPKNFIGHLTEGKNSMLLKCVEGNNKKSPITGEEMVWVCNEERAGEGQVTVHVNRNVAGLKYAIVYRKDIIQRLSKMYALKCDQLVSNK